MNDHRTSRSDACDWCGGTLDSLRYGKFGGRQCLDCRSILTRPLPSDNDLRLHYEISNSKYAEQTGSRIGVSGVEMLRRYAIKFMKVVSLCSPRELPSSLIDVGSSLSPFPRLALSNGISKVVSVDYVDTSEMIYDDVSRVVFDLCGDQDWSGCRADVVTCFAVLEHVKDPELAIKRLRKMMAKDGRLVIMTPIRLFSLCEYATNRWYTPPGHLSVPTTNGMIRALERSGLKVYKTSLFELNAGRFLLRYSLTLFEAILGFVLSMIGVNRFLVDRGVRMLGAPMAIFYVKNID